MSVTQAIRYPNLVVPMWCLLIFLILAGGVQAEMMGYYEVRSVPQGADVLVNGIFQGETPVIVPVVSANPNGTVLKIMTQGYTPWEQSYPVNPQNGSVTTIDATLVPISPTGTLTVDSLPQGGLVTVDNGNGQMTPWTYQNVPTGSHLVSISVSGFEPYIKTVEVSPGKETEITGTMVQRSGAGSLVISSVPGGATVYVDGVYAGISNTVVGNVAPGAHKVKITQAGYDDFAQEVTMPIGGQVSVEAVMKPYSGSEKGAIIITSDPPGASVYLDGSYSGVTEAGRPLEITEVAPGTHDVYMSMKNYEDYKTTVEVSSGNTSVISTGLGPSPMPQANGMLILTSEPQGADITFDGQYRGITPSTISPVSVGDHQYSLNLTGYQGYNSSVQIISGQVLQINTVLSSQAGAPPVQTTEKKTPAPSALMVLLMIAGAAILTQKRR